MNHPNAQGGHGQAGAQPAAAAYVAPPIEQRRAHVALARAHTEQLLTQVPANYRDRVFGCDHCGVLNPQDWCNNCEMRNIPWCAKHPGLHAPYCRACHTADLPCRNCGVKPSNGPDDHAFAPPGLGADQLFVQIAGTNMPNP